MTRLDSCDQGDCMDLLCDSLFQNPGVSTGCVCFIVEMLSMALPGLQDRNRFSSKRRSGAEHVDCGVPRHPAHRVFQSSRTGVMKKDPRLSGNILKFVGIHMRKKKEIPEPLRMYQVFGIRPSGGRIHGSVQGRSGRSSSLANQDLQPLF